MVYEYFQQKTIPLEDLEKQVIESLKEIKTLDKKAQYEIKNGYIECGIIAYETQKEELQHLINLYKQHPDVAQTVYPITE